MNEQNKERSYKIACDHSSSIAHANRLAGDIDTLLTTARQEAQAAAFKEGHRNRECDTE